MRVERVAVVVMAGQVRHLGRRRRQFGGGRVEIPIDGTAGRNEERVGPVHDPTDGGDGDESGDGQVGVTLIF